jgi:speckle-type POZ protein
MECKNIELFKHMLQWMYCGEIKFPEDIFEVFDLMLIADEYLISDLKQKCEEDMLAKLNETNIVRMLLLAERHPLVNIAITDRCKTLFIEDFDKIYKLNPDIELQIQSMPGLMVKLFSHIHSKKNMKRKVTFVFES